MPCPHYKVKISSRGKGQSAVAQAAYQSGDKLFDERSHRTRYYSEKRGIIYTEILLPPHAPPEYADRNILWNAVEAAEPNYNSQLARRIEVALPIELSMETNVALIREYCQEQFVSKGMIADIAIHDPDPPGHNPHAHVMLTMRPMDEHGQWMEKAHKVYDLDEHGERIPDYRGGWLFHKVNTTDWNEPENVRSWRRNWESIQNRYLEEAGREERVSMESYKDRGLDIVPMVHMGPAVAAMERRGILTNIGNLNREIRKMNRLIQKIRAMVRSFFGWLDDVKISLGQVDIKPREVVLADLMVQSVQERKTEGFTAWDCRYGARNSFDRFNAAIDYMRENQVMTVADLDARIQEIDKEDYPIRARFAQVNEQVRSLNKLVEIGERRAALDPVHQEYLKIHWKGKKEKFAQEHAKELKDWNEADRFLRAKLADKPYNGAALRDEISSLSAELETMNRQLEPFREETRTIEDIRFFVKDLLPELEPEKEPLLQPKLEQKQKSLHELLAKAKREADRRNAERSARKKMKEWER